MTHNQQLTFGLVALGAALSYVTHPLVWLCGPLRWVAMVLAAAAAESNFGEFDRADEANGTTSWGPLMFNDSRLDEIGGRAVAESPFGAGYATGGYVSRLILDHPAYLLVLPIPFLGYAWFRRAWTNPSAITGWTSLQAHTDAIGDVLDPDRPLGLRWFVRIRFATLFGLAVVLGLRRWGSS